VGMAARLLSSSKALLGLRGCPVTVPHLLPSHVTGSLHRPAALGVATQRQKTAAEVATQQPGVTQAGQLQRYLQLCRQTLGSQSALWLGAPPPWML